jgi:cyclic pyranopterin phosphate synthase
MVDVGGKDVVRRVATARGEIRLKPSTVDAVSGGKIKKGDVVSASKLAGIQAAKATSSILPLCHQIRLTAISVEIVPKKDRIVADCTVSAEYRTGVEMEALVGVTAALLNVWDMVKYLEKDEKGQYPGTMISDIRVVRKTKGNEKDGS